MTDARLDEIAAETGMACMGRCGRSNARGGRGCCVGCYNVLLKRVKAGEATWAELEKTGACRAPRKGWGRVNF